MNPELGLTPPPTPLEESLHMDISVARHPPDINRPAPLERLQDEIAYTEIMRRQLPATQPVECLVTGSSHPLYQERSLVYCCGEVIFRSPIVRRDPSLDLICEGVLYGAYQIIGYNLLDDDTCSGTYYYKVWSHPGRQFQLRK